MSLRFARRLALLVVLVLVAAPAAVGQPESEEELATSFFQVGALTSGRPDFIPEVMGVVSPDMVSDEENPLFGAEGEEYLLPVGTIDELIEQVKMNVDPVLWEITEGADVRSMGESVLVVTATPKLLDKVGRFLAELEARTSTTVTVEVATVAVPPRASLAGPADLLDAYPNGPSVIVSALDGQRVGAFAGSQVAFLQDHDVEVAQKAQISDPIVSVANFGLAVGVRPIAGEAGGRVRLVLDARLALLEEMREIEAGGDEGRYVELPQLAEARVTADLVVRDGAWTVAGGSGSAGDEQPWQVLVRAHVHRQEPAMSRTPHRFSTSTRPGSDELTTQTFDVSDLETPVASVRGPGLNLVPSNWTPPEPAELPDPAPLLPTEGIVDMLPFLVAPSSWNRQGTEIQWMWRRVLVTNTPRVLAAVGATLDELRREFLWSVVLDAEVLEVPAGLARIVVGDAGTYLLPDHAREALQSALEAGQARLVRTVRVDCMRGARNTVFAGRGVSYLQDFEVEIAEDARIANPVIQTIREGCELDVTAALYVGGGSVDAEVRFAHGTLERPLRQTETTHGPIDVPQLDLVRLRTNLAIPLERTAAVGAGADGPTARLLLLTPRLVRHAK